MGNTETTLSENSEQFNVIFPQKPKSNNASEQKILSATVQNNDNLPSTNHPVSNEFYIKIDKIGLKHKIIEDVDPNDPDQYLPIIDNYIAHGKYTSLPNEPEGNTYLFAHSKNTTLNRIPEGGWFSTIDLLEEEDLIEIHYQGDVYTYEVVNSVIIEPDNTSVYKSQSVFENTNSLTLQTCYPRGTTEKRLIITAKGVN